MTLKRTPLFETHVSAKAKIVPFAGWEMPVQYVGLVAEHVAVRTACGLFDVSHMGEIVVVGSGAESFLQSILSNDLSKLGVGKAQYNLLLNELGGVVDDLIVYKLSAEEFLLCVNASNTGEAFAWIVSRAPRSITVLNQSEQWGQIAVQGPKAFEVLERTSLPKSLAQIPPFGFKDSSDPKFGRLIVARTGYTGEDGVEIFCEPAASVSLWKELVAAGGVPCGLGARDTLRLEACYPLHGHELGTDISAFESDLGWVVKLQKGDFTGRAALAAQKQNGVPRLIVGFELTGPGIARGGDKIVDQQGRQIGMVTSGTKTPTVGKALGLALVPTALAAVGSPLSVLVRDKTLLAQVVRKPFYKRA